MVADGRIRQVETRLKQICCTASDVCQRLVKLEGIGPLITTTMVAAVGEPTAFKNGRQLAVWLGLVLRQGSSGGRQVLLGMSNRRDRYLRTLPIHGVRTVVWRAGTETASRGQ